MNPTVLIVEDDADTRALLARLVAAEGYRVELAQDGWEALERLRQHRPQLVLTDLMMPRMNGWQLHQSMLCDPDLFDIPVVILSAVADTESPQSRGVSACLCKPVDLDELLDKLHEFC
jgi:CheY-like chemotaxis protein